MKKIELPFVKMPAEFVTLLKSNLSATTAASSIFDIIRPNQALYMVLERSFQEFDDGRGLEKLYTALGWTSFRDRMAGLYIYKAIYGDWPSKTDLELVTDIKSLEQKYGEHGVHGYSRLFLLGFYLKLANIKLQARHNNQFMEIKVPDEVGPVLNLGLGRSERADWLVLISMHLVQGLGEKLVINSLIGGKKFEDLYALMPNEARANMHQNLLAYSASINEPDIFLYEKV